MRARVRKSCDNTARGYELLNEGAIELVPFEVNVTDSLLLVKVGLGSHIPYARTSPIPTRNKTYLAVECTCKGSASACVPPLVSSVPETEDSARPRRCL